MGIDASDEEVRSALTRLVAALGRAPSLEQLSEDVGQPPTEVEQRLQRLADAHALLVGLVEQSLDGFHVDRHQVSSSRGFGPDVDTQIS